MSDQPCDQAIPSPEAQTLQQMEATQQDMVVADTVLLPSAEHAVFYPYDDVLGFFGRDRGPCLPFY